MEITVRLLANLRRYLPEGENHVAGTNYQVPAGARVRDLLAMLPIPASDAYTFFVNGRHAEADDVLQPGDSLSVFPAVGGG